jgi:cobalt transporter subunit CbtB
LFETGLSDYYQRPDRGYKDGHQSREFDMTAVVIPVVRGKTEALKAAFVAFAVGATLIFTTGFSHIDNVHNAAHDTRHAMSFPCH